MRSLHSEGNLSACNLADVQRLDRLLRQAGELIDGTNLDASEVCIVIFSGVLELIAS